MAALAPSESQPLLDGGDAPRGLAVAASGLSYAAPASRGRPGALLLRDVTLVVPRRGVLPVMGPSGSGKSTLLEVLSGRRRGGFASGEALFGGWPLSAHRRGTVAFAPQDCADLLDGGLTARETLDFAAALRMLGARTAARGPGRPRAQRSSCRALASRCACSRAASSSVSIGEARRLARRPPLRRADDGPRQRDGAVRAPGLAGLPAARVTVAFSLHQPPYGAFEPLAGGLSPTSASSSRSSRSWACSGALNLGTGGDEGDYDAYWDLCKLIFFVQLVGAVGTGPTLVPTFVRNIDLLRRERSAGAVPVLDHCAASLVVHGGVLFGLVFFLAWVIPSSATAGGYSRPRRSTADFQRGSVAVASAYAALCVAVLRAACFLALGRQTRSSASSGSARSRLALFPDGGGGGCAYVAAWWAAQVYAAVPLKFAQVVLTAQAPVQLVATAATFVEQASVGFLLLAQVMSAFSGYNVLISTMSRVEVSLTYLDFMRWGTQAQYLAAFRDNLCYHDPRFWEALGYLFLSFAFYAGAQLPVLRYRTWATVL
ncbi:ATPase [Aureococcus anophagefferens]|nr:ATPase [Aureococcus anophagefferens]